MLKKNNSKVSGANNQVRSEKENYDMAAVRNEALDSSAEATEVDDKQTTEERLVAVSKKETTLQAESDKTKKIKILSYEQMAAKEQRKIYILSFLVPFCLLALSWAGSNFYPLGERTPLTIDLYHQYAPFLSEIRYKLLHGEDLFFSWHIGLGTNFYALLSYYLASPLNILTIFFPLEHLSTAVACLTLLKVGLAGLFMSFYLNEAFFDKRGDRSTFPSLVKTKNGRFNLRRDGIRSSIIIGLAAAYAVSAFNLSYAWNIMWLDAIALMPLLLLGQDRLLRKKKPFLYIITLAIMLISNYYISFFNLLFIALYFFVLSPTLLHRRDRLEIIYKDIQEQKNLEQGGNREQDAIAETDSLANKPLRDRKRNSLPFKYSPLAEFLRQGFSFLGATLLGLGLSAILLLPTIISLKSTSASGDDFPSYNEFRFSILHFISRSIIGSSPDIREGLPNIYVGMLLLLIIPLFFISKKISFKEKLLHVSLLVFMFISLNSSVLNFVWHGMHYPNQLPHRFAYLYGLLLIIIAARALTAIDIKDNNLKYFRWACLIVIGLAVLTEELFWDDWSSSMIYLAIGCLVFYYLLSLYFEKKRIVPRLLASMFLIVFIAELALNGISMIQQVNHNEYFTKRPDFIRDMSQVETLLDEARKDSADRVSEDSSQVQADDFYRMEYMPAKTTNDPALFSYNGFTLFASTSNENVAKMFRKLGYHGNNINSYKYVASTNFMNSLFRIRYLIIRDKELSNNQYEQISETSNETQHFRLYRNKYDLPLSITLDSAIDNWLEEDASPFTYQNQLYTLGLESELNSNSSNNANDRDNNIFKHLIVREQKLENFTAARRDADLGYSFNAGEKGPKSKISLEIPIEEDTHAYFFVKVVRSLKVSYKVKRSNSTLESNEEKLSSPESSMPTPEEQEAEKNKKLELKEDREINKPEIFDVGECKKGDLIEVSMEFVDNLDNPIFWAAGTNDKNLQAAYSAIQKRDSGIRKVDNRRLEGVVNLNSEKTVLVTVPYDKGWRVSSNGETIETFALGGGLLAFHLPAGTHDVKIEFLPQGMMAALVIFLTSLIILLLLFFYMKFFVNKRNKEILSRDGELYSDSRIAREVFGVNDFTRTNEQQEIAISQNSVHSVESINEVELAQTNNVRPFNSAPLTKSESLDDKQCE